MTKREHRAMMQKVEWEREQSNSFQGAATPERQGRMTSHSTVNRVSEKARQRQEAIDRLKEWIKPGDTIYTSVKHVARSGMYRTIAVYVIENNEPRWISYLVAKAIGARFDEKRDAVGMGGCGMDMGFALVYDLSRTLFREGFHCIGKGDTYRCHSNDHSNEREANFTKGRLHSDPGYALNQRWM